jgi:hypothetical protein
VRYCDAKSISCAVHRRVTVVVVVVGCMIPNTEGLSPGGMPPIAFTYHNELVAMCLWQAPNQISAKTLR